MKRLIKAVSRAARESEVWPAVLLLAAVVVPATCLIWFMSAAMRNERLASRQKLVDVYRTGLSAVQRRLECAWDELAMNLEGDVRTGSAPAAFARCIQSGMVDSLLIFNEDGHLLYPNTPSAPKSDAATADPRWEKANNLEYIRKDLTGAAELYRALANESTNTNVSARALQAEARCLVRAGKKEAAVRLINDVFSNERYSRAADAQGRLIIANAELMALEILTNHNSPAFQIIAERLSKRLMDYENPVLAAPQRRFLMKQVQALSAQATGFPTMAAENLAAQMSEKHPNLDSALVRAPVEDIWQFATADRRVLAFLRSDRLLASMQTTISLSAFPSDAQIRLLAPGEDDGAALVSLPANAQWPGWRLALSLKDPKFFDASTQHRTAIYLWTGILVVAVMSALTLLTLRSLRRQTALARLKNDLAATVSHELKTPLSSMRVLVDTLLDSERLDERTTREYLGLIARENDRLSRLIQNFLTFSRIERKKYPFDFVPVPIQQVVEGALETMRERFEAPGCHFELQFQPDLPEITADADALKTAIINLLDNAWKYSAEIKHIVLRVTASDKSVVLSVHDNGVGIAPRDRKKIFEHFYQADQLLSRKEGGCGLGLAIVQSIVDAHNGSISVESQPGRGSTFTISLPAPPGSAAIDAEAIA